MSHDINYPKFYPLFPWLRKFQTKSQNRNRRTGHREQRDGCKMGGDGGGAGCQRRREEAGRVGSYRAATRRLSSTTQGMRSTTRR